MLSTALTGDSAVLLTARAGHQRASVIPDDLEQELEETHTWAWAESVGGHARWGVSCLSSHCPHRPEYTSYSCRKPALVLAALSAHAWVKLAAVMGWSLGGGVGRAEGTAGSPALAASALLSAVDRSQEPVGGKAWGPAPHLARAWGAATHSEGSEGPSGILFRRQLCSKMYWLLGGGGV